MQNVSVPSKYEITLSLSLYSSLNIDLELGRHLNAIYGLTNKEYQFNQFNQFTVTSFQLTEDLLLHTHFLLTDPRISQPKIMQIMEMVKPRYDV